MSQTPIVIAPQGGVVKTESGRVVEGRYTDAPNMRFVPGTDGIARPQKIGGWTRKSSVVTAGVGRSSHAWRDLIGNQYFAAGTSQKIYVYDNAFAQSDITPFLSTGTLASNPFFATSGLTNIVVTHANHNRSLGDWVSYSGASTFSGVTLNGSFQITSVTGINTYTIDAPNVANATASGGGTPAYSYDIHVGTDVASYGNGAGAGYWGLGAWGAAHGTSVTATEPRIWSLDNFGQILIASYNGGTIYTFDPTASQPWPRMAVISTAPTDCRFVFVTAERYVVALRDSMVMSWSDQANYNVWTPATGNTANTRTLTEGSRLIAGRVLGPRQSAVWSDSACYSMQWTGDIYVYQTDVVGKNCGLISPNAVVVVANAAFWMGPDNFWMLSGGGVQPIPNVEDIRRYVFDDLTDINGFQCHAVYVAKFNEIWFGYTAAGDVEISRYVIYSLAAQKWAPGFWTRSTGSNFSQGDTRPYMADIDGYIYLHEDGVDANGAALSCSLTLAPYAMSEGAANMDMWGFLLDTFEQSGDITLRLNSWDRLSDTSVQDTETDVISPATGFMDTRISGRYIGFTATSNAVGGYFRMGKPVAFVSPSGTRS